MTIRRKGSLSKLFSFAALDDELSNTNNDSTKSFTTVPKTRTRALPTDLDSPDTNLITAQTVVHDKELFAEFQSKVRESRTGGTSLSTGAVLGEFIKEKNGLLVRHRAFSNSDSSVAVNAITDNSDPSLRHQQEQDDNPSLGFVKAAADTTKSAKRFLRQASGSFPLALLQSLGDEHFIDDKEEDGDGSISSSNMLANLRMFTQAS